MLSKICLFFSLSLSVAAMDDTARSNNAFGFSLFNEASAPGQNLVLSPFSIWSALAMTSAGAEGETLKEMRKVLSLPASGSQELVGGWSASLTQAKGVQMSVANRLWGNKSTTFKPGFLSVAEKQYGAGLETVSFSANPDAARKQINHWVAGKTHDKITDLLAPGTVGRDTRLVLTNAVYFQGLWQIPFKASLTHKEPFKTSASTTVSADAMFVTLHAGYYENSRLQAVKLAYKGEEMAMIVVLPKEAGALADRSFLGASQFADIFQGTQGWEQVVVQLPKFEASAKLELPSMLKKLGMRRAFTDKAQYQPMAEEPVKLSEVVHQAWIKVTEQGTEAAAATAVGVRTLSAPRRQEPKKFTVDHPFLFFVVDDRNGGIVFAGRIMDPTK